MSQSKQMPAILRDFLTYHETIQGHAKNTADEYYLDLRTFFRFIKRYKNSVPSDMEFDAIDIDDVDLALVASITLTDVYAFVNYLSRDRMIGAAARARKIAAIRSFYKYLTNKAKLLDENPVQDLDTPRLKKSLPRYLNLSESILLLEAVDGKYQARDYCIIMFFLNCGLRISELSSINITDVRDGKLRVLGKGNKERIVYLNDACMEAYIDCLSTRENLAKTDSNALFISKKFQRMSNSAIHRMLKKRFLQAGLDPELYSAHKLRHTAATLMLQNGVDVRTLQEVLGHEHLNTTQIYTHVDDDNLRLAAKANPLSKIKKAKT